MSCEVTWMWEYWKEVSERSGARVLVCLGQETRVVEFEDNGINRMLSWKFPEPIQCSDGDQIAQRLVYEVSHD